MSAGRQGRRPVRQRRQHGDGPQDQPHHRGSRVPISKKSIDLGFVGEPEKVDVTTVLTQILGRDLIPVLAPLATSADGTTFNVNADTFAGAIAGALKAKRLLLLTDVPGVLDKSKIIDQANLSADDARRLIADGTISGGMIPKVETCLYALEAGVEGVVILDGTGSARRIARTPHRPRRRHADEADRRSNAAMSWTAPPAPQPRSLPSRRDLDFRSRQHALSASRQSVGTGRRAHSRLYFADFLKSRRATRPSGCRRTTTVAMGRSMRGIDDRTRHEA